MTVTLLESILFNDSAPVPQPAPSGVSTDEFSVGLSVQTFSAESKQGVDTLRGVVARWLQI